MKTRLSRVTEDQHGSRMAEFELADGTTLGLSIKKGDLEAGINEAIEGYRKAMQKTEVPLSPELVNREFDIPELSTQGTGFNS